MAYRSRKTGKMRVAGAGRRRTVTADIDSRAFEKAVDRAREDYTVATHEAAGRAGHRIRNKATRYTPVDTGRLKGAWQVTEGEDLEGPYWEVSNDVDYAPDVEYGTEHMAPQPMIRPAVAEELGVQGIGVDRPTIARK